MSTLNDVNLKLAGILGEYGLECHPFKVILIDYFTRLVLLEFL